MLHLACSKINHNTMKKVSINPTSNTPKVIFDPSDNIFEISGESRPFDVPSFYQPLLTWLDDFNKELSEIKVRRESIKFKFNLEYFNSLSAKYILDLCKKLSKIYSDGHKIDVIWQYETGDDYMYESGQEMSRIARMPFNYEEIRV
jgi:hypothetical protein